VPLLRLTVSLFICFSISCGDSLRLSLNHFQSPISWPSYVLIFILQVVILTDEIFAFRQPSIAFGARILKELTQKMV
jgi:hypothetical protein